MSITASKTMQDILESLLAQAQGVGQSGAGGFLYYVNGTADGVASPDLLGDFNANPLYILGIPHFYNGASYDRQRGNVNTVTGDIGSKIASFNGATQTNHNAKGAWIAIRLGAVSGTTPTLSAQMQWSPDGGTTWINFGPALANLIATGQVGLIGVYPANWSQAAGVTPANLTNGANQSMFVNAPLPRTWRIVYTIGGTTPNFAITEVDVNYIN